MVKLFCSSLTATDGQFNEMYVLCTTFERQRCWLPSVPPPPPRVSSVTRYRRCEHRQPPPSQLQETHMLSALIRHEEIHFDLESWHTIDANEAHSVLKKAQIHKREKCHDARFPF